MMHIVVIDTESIIWNTFHTVQYSPNYIVSSFLEYLFMLQHKFSADRIVFACDSTHSLRRELFSGYKCKRNKKKQEYTADEKAAHQYRIQQTKLLKTHVLPKLGFTNVFEVKGYEGDDIVASVVQANLDDFVTIVGRDNDLYQLLSPNCRMFDTYNRTIIDEEVFFDKYGIYPDMWADVKGIAGCATDEVPGVPGIGPDRAIKYLLNKMKPTSTLYKRIVSSQDVIELTRKLVVLPFEGTPTFTLEKNKCRVVKLRKVARELGLRDFLTREVLIEFGELFCKK